MTIENPENFNGLEQFNQDYIYCAVDKNTDPNKFKKSIMILMNTKQAREIRDYLDSQIRECPDDNCGTGIIIHTGLCAK